MAIHSMVLSYFSVNQCGGLTDRLTHRLTDLHHYAAGMVKI